MNDSKMKEMTARYNQRNPGNPVKLIIEQDDCWFEDMTGRRLTAVDEKKIWDCYED